MFCCAMHVHSARRSFLANLSPTSSTSSNSNSGIMQPWGEWVRCRSSGWGGELAGLLSFWMPRQTGIQLTRAVPSLSQAGDNGGLLNIMTALQPDNRYAKEISCEATSLTCLRGGTSADKHGTKDLRIEWSYCRARRGVTLPHANRCCALSPVGVLCAPQGAAPPGAPAAATAGCCHSWLLPKGAVPLRPCFPTFSPALQAVWSHPLHCTALALSWPLSESVEFVKPTKNWTGLWGWFAAGSVSWISSLCSRRGSCVTSEGVTGSM